MKSKLFLLCLLLTSCSFKENNSSHVNLSFYFDGQSSQTSVMDFPAQRRLNAFAAITPPSSIYQFDCFAVNVMGQGIAPFISGNFNADIPRLIGGDLCASYPGPNSIMVNSSFSGSVNLQVPSGAARYIQVLGFPRTDMGCRADKPWVAVINETNDPPNYISNHFGGLFEVGSVVRDLFRDEEIQVMNSYNPNQPRDLLDCIDGPGPSDFPSLKYWYLADEFQDLYNSGSVITTNWRNAKPQVVGVPILNSFGGPTFHSAAGPNGKPIVRFDGTNDKFQDITVAGGTNTVGATVFALVKANTTATIGIFGITNGTDFSMLQSYFFLYAQSNFFKFSVRNSASDVAIATLGATYSTSQYYVLTAWYEASTGNIQIEGNHGLGSMSGNDPDITSVALGASAGLFMGSEGLTGNYFDGDIAEVIFFDRLLNSSERNSMKEYFSRKYGQPYN